MHGTLFPCQKEMLAAFASNYKKFGAVLPPRSPFKPTDQVVFRDFLISSQWYRMIRHDGVWYSIIIKWYSIILHDGIWYISIIHQLILNHTQWYVWFPLHCDVFEEEERSSRRTRRESTGWWSPQGSRTGWLLRLKIQANDTGSSQGEIGRTLEVKYLGL